MAPPSPHSRASVRSLPLDALYEILLRLPAKDLCRLRAVCRPWRSLLSDPHFIATHAARHPEPLIVAGYHGNRPPSAGPVLDIMDLSGRIIKRVIAPASWVSGKEWVMTAQLDALCVVTEIGMSCLLLNPATVSVLPRGFPEHCMQERGISSYRQLVTIGKVASTGEYKVLRLIYRHSHTECEVFTINGSSHARWREKKASPARVDFCQWSRVAINGIVYFLSPEFVMDQDGMPLRLSSFDLETEEWRAILLGPLNLMDINIHFNDLSLACLNGCLVVVHCTRCSSMDLWFLTDFEKGLWVKQHSIQLKLSFLHDKLPVRPLLVLNDGRILVYIGDMGSMRIYDPNTCTYTDVARIGRRYEIGLYTGNLLRLPDGAGAQLMR